MIPLPFLVADTSAILSLPWIDQVGLVLLAVFLVLGAIRGLWWQIVRLLGVVLAVTGARALAPRWVDDMQASFDLSPGPAYGLTWFTIFVLGLVVAALLGRLGKKALDAMQLGPVDRLGGALAGGLTGLMLHGALLFLLTGLGTTEWSTRTLAGSKSERLLDTVSHRWPLFVDASVRERVVGPWVDALGWQTRPQSPEPETGDWPADGSPADGSQEQPFYREDRRD